MSKNENSTRFALNDIVYHVSTKYIEYLFKGIDPDGQAILIRVGDEHKQKITANISELTKKNN